MGDSSMEPPQRAQKAKTAKRDQTVAKTTAKNTSRSPVSKFKQSSATRKGLKAGKTSYSGLKTRKNIPVKSVKTKRAIHEYTEIGLQDFAVLLFGEDAVKEVKKKMDVREIWNISTNTTQCNNVIGKSNAETDCWICIHLRNHLQILMKERFLKWNMAGRTLYVIKISLIYVV
jgi:hypothetical protein